MREEGWADVGVCLERVFEDRCCVRQLSGAKDNWLELPVGEGDGRRLFRGEEIDDEVLESPS